MCLHALVLCQAWACLLNENLFTAFQISFRHILRINNDYKAYANTQRLFSRAALMLELPTEVNLSLSRREKTQSMVGIKISLSFPPTLSFGHPLVQMPNQNSVQSFRIHSWMERQKVHQCLALCHCLQ